MTAKEAYTKTLWNKLPNGIKDFIIGAVYNGKFQVDIEWRFYASANPSPIESLQKLGYSVNCTEDKTLQISWDCVND